MTRRRRPSEPSDAYSWSGDKIRKWVFRQTRNRKLAKAVGKGSELGLRVLVPIVRPKIEQLIADVIHDITQPAPIKSRTYIKYYYPLRTMDQYQGITF